MAQDEKQQPKRQAIETALDELREVVRTISERSFLIERTLLVVPPPSPAEGTATPEAAAWLVAILDSITGIKRQLQPASDALQHVIQETSLPGTPTSIAREVLRR